MASPVQECPTCGLHPHDFTVDEYKRELDRVEAERDRLREALEHYADEDHWSDVTPGPEINTAGYLAFEYDGGHEKPWQVAREALSRPENERG